MCTIISTLLSRGSQRVGSTAAAYRYRGGRQRAIAVQPRARAVLSVWRWNVPTHLTARRRQKLRFWKILKITILLNKTLQLTECITKVLTRRDVFKNKKVIAFSSDITNTKFLEK